MLQDDLLYSWIDASLLLKTNRFLNDVSLYEMLILKEISSKANVKANDLCLKLNLLKSQMSHILDNMLKKGFITKTKDENDKRNYFLKITDLGLSMYKKEHDSILVLMSKIENALGSQKAEDLCSLLKEATRAIKELKND